MKILFVVPTKGWAFDNVTTNLIKYLNHNVEKIYYADFTPKYFEKYDCVHFMNWLNVTIFKSKLSASVCSHNFELSWIKESPNRLARISKISATSNILYEKVKKFNKKTYYTPFGVDADMFDCKEKNGSFVVGWAGWPTSGGFGEELNNESKRKYDIKCYHLILKPLIEKLKNKVEFSLLDDVDKFIPHDKMAEWYSNIDCFLCTSMYEGGPLPVFEAAASGRAIISTKVGRTAELIKHGFNGYLIDAPRNRNDLPAIIEQFEKYILELKEYRNICKLMGERNRIEILQNWTWEKVFKYWEVFFNA